MKKAFMKYGLFGLLMGMALSVHAQVNLSAQAQIGTLMGIDSVHHWQVVRENVQKHFPHTVPPGNYSGITHLHDDIYAVVSDKSDSALYFNFQIQVNPESGDLERVECLGFSEYVDGSRKDVVQQESLSWQGKQKGFDHEAIAKVSDSTVVIASEGYFRLKEYPIIGENTEESSVSKREKTALWEREWPSSRFYPNYVFESLAYDSIRHLLWTIPESTLRQDGEPATPQNGQANKLRLMCFDWQGEKAQNAKGFSDGRQSELTSCADDRQSAMTSYAYKMDAPTTNRQAQTYVMGVSELCTLPDGQLLVLEREAFIPKAKLGSFCRCKLYLIDPLHTEPFPMSEKMTEHTPFLKKRLLTEWETKLTLLGRSFANYEGMCLGPKLKDGSQVLILLSDSQDQYAGVLKDWFKTIVIN